MNTLTNFKNFFDSYIDYYSSNKIDSQPLSQILEDFIQCIPSKDFKEFYKYTDAFQQLKKACSTHTTTPFYTYITETEDYYRIAIANTDKSPFSNEKPIDKLPKNLLEGLQGNIVVQETNFKVDEKYLHELLKRDKNVFKALNILLSRKRVDISIPENHHLQKPIWIEYCFSEDKSIVSPNINLHLGKDSKATILIENVDNQKDVFINSYLTTSLDDRAKLELGVLLNESDRCMILNNTDFSLKKESILSIDTISLGSKMARNNLEISLEGERSHAKLNGIYNLANSSHTDNNTIVNHLVPNTTSDEMYKGILKGKSKAVFNGKIYVEKDAQKTQAFQSNKNILLSNDVKLRTKPELEIFADDVKCSHGATIGKIDEDQLFYLMSRGLSKESANEILINSFLNEIVEKIEDSFIREKARKLLNLKELNLV